MKQLFAAFVLLCCHPALRAQNISFDFQAGAGPAFQRFSHEDAPPPGRSGLYNFLQVSASGRLDKSFFLRTEFGLATFRQELDTRVYGIGYDGRYTSQKLYGSLLVEYRFARREQLFVNAGGLLVQDVHNQFYGTIDGTFADYRNLSVRSGVGAAANVGIRTGFGNVGIVHSFGVGTMAPIDDLGSFVERSTVYLNFKTGITFNINSTPAPVPPHRMRRRHPHAP